MFKHKKKVLAVILAATMAFNYTPVVSAADLDDTELIEETVSDNDANHVEETSSTETVVVEESVERASSTETETEPEETVPASETEVEESSETESESETEIETETVTEETEETEETGETEETEETEETLETETEEPEEEVVVEYQASLGGHLDGNTAVADEYYRFVNWTDENGNVVSTADTFETEESGVYTANFEEFQYTITFAPVLKDGSYAEGDFGYVDPENATVSISSYEDLEATAVALDGYEFVGWIDANGNEVSDDATFAPSVCKNTTFKAEFVSDIQEREITATCRGSVVSAKGMLPQNARLVASRQTYIKSSEDIVQDTLPSISTFSAEYVFDIKIMVGNEEWQPVEHGTDVEITIDGVDLRGIQSQTYTATKVYRITEEDDVTDLSVTEETNNSVSFVTDHFTDFVVGGATYLTESADGSVSVGDDLTAYWFASDELVIITGSGASMTEYSDNATAISSLVGDNEFDVVFADVPNLTYVAGFNGTNIRTAALLDYTTYIGVNAFKGCSHLEMQDLPSSLIYIGNSAFQGCTNVTFNELPASCTNINQNAFKGASRITISSVPVGTSSIGSSAFMQCTGIGAMDLSNYTGSTIPAQLFSACSNLESVTLPDTITSIGDQAFLQCTKLNMDLPSSVTNIGIMAFSGCENLEGNEDIIQNVTTLGIYAFQGCKKLETVNLATLLTTIPEGCFYGCLLFNVGSYGMNITSIGDSAFQGCVSMTNVPWAGQYGSITSIGNYAFQGCSSISFTKLPNSLRTIGTGAFSGCTAQANYHTIWLPDNIQSIGAGAFFGFNARYITSSASTETSYGTFPQLTSIGTRAFGLSSPYSATNMLTTRLYANNAIIDAYDWADSYRKIYKSVTLSDQSYLNSSSQATNVTGTTYEVTDAEVWDLSNGAGTIKGYWLPTENKAIISGYGVAYNNNSFISAVKDHNAVILWDNDTANGGITSLYSTFYGMTGTYIADPPATVTTIGEHTFFQTSIKGVNIPAGVTSIGAHAFEQSGITTLTVPASVTTIATSAFSTCQGLSTLTINGAITAIPADMCRNCNNLTAVAFSDTVTTIGDSAFNGCKKLATLGDWSNVTSIGYKSFSKCEVLTFSSLPAGLTTLGDPLNNRGNAFEYCYGITSLDFSECPGLTEILPNTCYYCLNLESVVIPATVTAIGANAFYDCLSLSEITAYDGTTCAPTAFSTEVDRLNGTNGWDLEGEYGSDGAPQSISTSTTFYHLPIATTLTGDAAWFDTYDWHLANRVIGSYQITLPMSISLEYDGNGSFGEIDYTIDNQTNDWIINIEPKDNGNDYLTLTCASGTVQCSFASDQANNDYAKSVTSGRVSITTSTVLTEDAEYTGSLTFTARYRDTE